MAWRCSQTRQLDCSRGVLLVDAGTVLAELENVEPYSEVAAAKARLARGDLVLAINGVACDAGSVVVQVEPDKPAARAGVRPWMRIDSVFGRPASHHPPREAA